MKSKRVLIVEDAIDIQRLLADMLSMEGYQIECFKNGREALNYLSSCDSYPALILLDLMMPEMDGYAFREEQKKRPKIAGIPIVLMTADGDIRAKATRLDASGFLKKPFLNIDLILNTVERFCSSTGN